jgi:hypothetical protein
MDDATDIPCFEIEVRKINHQHCAFVFLHQSIFPIKA